MFCYFLDQLADNQDFESPLYGLSAYRSLRRQRHLVCPECRADVTVPSEGFPVCRLTESIRENFERAQSQASEIPVKQPEKKSKERQYQYYSLQRLHPYSGRGLRVIISDDV